MKKNLLILLDNGHGCNTPGKCSPDKSIKEFEYSRLIVKGISLELNRLGIENVIVVPELEDICLKERCRRVNSYCTKDKMPILVSVHCNASGCDNKWHSAAGWSVYTSVGVTEADTVARFFYKAAEEIFPKDRRIRKYNNDKEPDFESNLYILKHTRCPAVLTENFFQDNESDVDYMLTSQGQVDIITCHVKGIQDYIKYLGER